MSAPKTAPRSAPPDLAAELKAALIENANLLDRDAMSILQIIELSKRLAPLAQIAKMQAQQSRERVRGLEAETAPKEGP